MLDISESNLITKVEFFHSELKSIIRLRLSQNIEKSDLKSHNFKAKIN
jgi:hypothetical protein